MRFVKNDVNRENEETRQKWRKSPKMTKITENHQKLLKSLKMTEISGKSKITEIPQKIKIHQ